MPKSKKRKPKPKKKRKLLVFELLPSGERRDINPRYLGQDHRWIGEVYTEVGLECEEFTLQPDKPLSLGDFLVVVREELPELVPEPATGCGVKVFLYA